MLLKIENGHYKALVAARTRQVQDKEEFEKVPEMIQMTRKSSGAFSFKHDEAVVEDTNSESSEDVAAPDVPLARVWALSRPDIKHFVIWQYWRFVSWWIVSNLGCPLDEMYCRLFST